MWWITSFRVQADGRSTLVALGHGMRVGLDGSRSGHRDETTCILHELQAVFALSAAWRVSGPATSRPPPPSVTTGTPPSRRRTLTIPAQAVAVCTICCTRRRTEAV